MFGLIVATAGWAAAAGFEDFESLRRGNSLGVSEQYEKLLRPAPRRAADFTIAEQHDNRPDHGHDKADWITFTVPSKHATDKPADERSYDTQENRHNHSSRIGAWHDQ